MLRAIATVAVCLIIMLRRKRNAGLLCWFAYHRLLALRNKSYANEPTWFENLHG
jgi:hypothetical protein